MVQCPNEPNIIVAITSTETRKGEVGVSKFIPSHLICLFFDEPFFRVIHPAWTEALIEARARIDAILR